MSLNMFGKKKKKYATVSEMIKADKPVDVVDRKKKIGMSQIFHESVFETILTDFQNNESFIHRENGEDKYVGLLLHADTIGGLDKRSQRDEAKGSIIECIDSGRIKTFITSELLDDNSIIIIPTTSTIGVMDEFGLLTDATYELCFVTNSGDIELLGIDVTYNDIYDVISTDGHIDDILHITDQYEDEYEEEEASSALLEEEPMMAEPTNGYTEDIPYESEQDIVNDTIDDDIEDDIDDDVEGAFDDVSEEGELDANPVYEEEVSYQEPVQEYAEEESAEQPVEQVSEPEKEVTIPSEWLSEAVNRKFYSDDLGLEVSTEPFDVQFLVGNPFTPFDEHRPEGFINDHLNEMSREANVKMERMHREHLFVMRERYFRLMSKQCDRIQKDLDVNSNTTQYGQMKVQIHNDYIANIDGIESSVARQKDILEQDWREKLKEIGMDAAREAQHKYRERYGAAHDQQMYDLQNIVRANVDAEYQYALRDINDRRREEASVLLDLSITEVLDEISDMYAQVMKEEQDCYLELQRDMQEFRTEHLKDEIAKNNVLAEQARIKNEVSQVLEEQTAKIQTMSHEFSVRKAQLTETIEDLRNENANKIKSLIEDHEKTLAVQKERADEWKTRYEELRSDYHDREEKKNKENETRIEELKQEMRDQADSFEQYVKARKHSGLIASFLVTAAVIASLLIGFVIGETVNEDRNAKQQDRAIERQNIENEIQP